MSRVTVIVPAYDSAGTIRHALESIQAQTFQDWEVIVGDDASRDKTPSVVEALDDPRITLVQTSENSGPASARNLALRNASGDLVAFLDSDDWWRPDYLERQVGRYDKEVVQPGAPVGIVACNAVLARQDGTLGDRTYFDLLGRRAGHPLTLDRLLRRNTIFISCLVPRRVGEAVGWFDPDLFGTEDHDLWLKILEREYRVVLDTDTLAVYRQTGSSISRNTARQAQNNQKTLNAALDRGRLTRRQRRIARSELRYNRALEVVAATVFDGDRPSTRALPGLAWVGLTRPHHWSEWLRALQAR